jgi:hypothetical protein
MREKVVQKLLKSGCQNIISLIIKNKIKISYVTWSQNVYIPLHLHRGRDSSRTEQHGTAGSDLFWSAQR